MLAAVDLFTERGFDATTVAEIAERAGVTKSTFFRYFPDKRDILVAGQAVLAAQLADGIAAAPAGSDPVDAVACGLDAVSEVMTPFNRELAPRLAAAVAANAELQERDALKQVGLGLAMTAALRSRGVPDATAQLAAELGVIAFRRGFEQWVAADADDVSLAECARAALRELQEAAASIGRIRADRPAGE